MVRRGYSHYCTGFDRLYNFELICRRMGLRYKMKECSAGPFLDPRSALGYLFLWGIQFWFPLCSDCPRAKWSHLPDHPIVKLVCIFLYPEFPLCHC